MLLVAGTPRGIGPSRLIPATAGVHSKALSE
jgi:hypothetical protein